MDWEILRVRLEQAEARAMKAEARAMKAEVRVERAEARAERAETRAERAETRLENARRRAELAERLLKSEKSKRGKKIASIAMTDDSSVISAQPFDREVWDLDSIGDADNIRTRTATTTKKRSKPLDQIQRERKKYISAEEAFETPDHKSRSASRSIGGYGDSDDVVSEQTVTDYHPDQYRNPRRKHRKHREESVGPNGMNLPRSPSLTPSDSMQSASSAISNSVQSTSNSIPYLRHRRGSTSGSRDWDDFKERSTRRVANHGRYRSNSVPITRYEESTIASEISISCLQAPPDRVARSIPRKLPGYYQSAKQLKIIAKKERFGFYKILGYRFSKSTARITNKFIELVDGCRKFSDIPEWHIQKAYEDLRNRISYELGLSDIEADAACGYLQEICMFLLRISSRQDYDQAQNRLRGSRMAPSPSPRAKRVQDSSSKRRNFIRGSRLKKQMHMTTKRGKLDAKQEKKAIPSIDELLRMVSDAEKTGDWYDMSERTTPRKNTWGKEKKVRTSRTPRTRKKNSFEERLASRRDPARSTARKKKSRWDGRGVYGETLPDSDRARPAYSRYSGTR